MRKIQELGGLINRWAYADRFRKYWEVPFGAPMRYLASTGAWVRWDNDQVWISLWDHVRLMRSMAGSKEIWTSLFRGSLLGVISVEKRRLRTNPPVTATWAIGDSALTRLAAFNWERREFAVDDAEYFYPN